MQHVVRVCQQQLTLVYKGEELGVTMNEAKMYDMSLGVADGC